ncbi:hypothetical protein, partial [Clostridium perfringens]
MSMRTLALTIGAAMLVPAAAQAQQAAPAAPVAQANGTATATATTPTVGATIYDSAGVSLGTVAQVTPQAIILNTGT